MLLSLGIALMATAATPRAICACTTNEKAYVASMKADLRNLVTAQEAFFSDSLRYAVSLSELDSTRFRLSSGVEWLSLEGWAEGFSARVHYPSAVTQACWINVGRLPDGSENEFDGEPRCDPSPPEMFPIIAGLVYGSLVLVAFGIRVARAGNGLPPMGVGTMSRFFLLCVVHPFWPHDRMSVSCYSTAEAIELFWVLMMAAITIWMAMRSVADWEPPRAA